MFRKEESRNLVTGAGDNAGAQSLKGKTMIVQAINSGDIGADHFDLLIPGGGLGAMQQGCPKQWGSVNMGTQYGGFLADCGTNMSCVTSICARRHLGAIRR